MEKMRLGKTELMVTKTSFGALPIQRRSVEDAVKILRKAYDCGINYFDTANMYTDSEMKIGLALSDVRQNIVISTKSGGATKAETAAHIENSLRMLKTDYIDLLQFHNPSSLPDINDPDGPFAAVLEAKKKGYVRHIGITNHSLKVAKEAIASGNFETLQFPFSYLASDEEVELTKLCKEADMGFIAMKGLAGGLLNNAAACRAYIRQFDNVVPIWGIQTEEELDQWIALEDTPAEMTPELMEVIKKDREELAGNFCRSCGYCMPCTVGIDIRNAARMNCLLRRSPYQPYMTKEYYKQMHKIDDCVDCGKCKSRCPYGLDTPNVLRYMLKDYDEFYEKYGEK